MDTDSRPATPLEDLLADLVDAHRTLLDASRRQRQAIAQADAPAMARTTDSLAKAGAAIVALEQRRRDVVVAMLRANPDAPRTPGAQPTLRALCRLLPDPACHDASALADQLRTLLLDIRRETRGARAATATLIAHMDAIVTQIGRRLSHDATYTRPGSRGAISNVVSGIDLTS